MAERQSQQDLFDKMPDRIKARLFDTGTKIWVGTSADQTPGWPSFAADRGITPGSRFSDGRSYGTLSFYVPDRREIFISVRNRGGSVNVYTHEMGHAIDYQWTGDVKRISDDPEWIELHDTYIRPNPEMNSYFRGGPTGNNAGSGRRELFAEGFAIYNASGRTALVEWIKISAAADEMIAIWKRYGVIE